ncbi:unnamed protein product [Strongylus vulgaris]|uniref:SHSP domain-containing protein n=1 Tax=Strongylus vulgaris TaxID=40348 RepID=A0A3P7JIC2_STRVU|nr:unnamed protein product [Strongylus vulgaris]
MWTGSTLEKYVRDLGNSVMSYWDDPVPAEQKCTDNIQPIAYIQIINEITRFAISIDVSQYKLEELQVHLIGRDLIIEGNQEKPDVEGYIQNTFLRRWTLPDDVDLDAVEISLNEHGCLVVDAPKTGLHTLRRELPIKIIDEITRFAISIDVSQYKLEELQVHLIGRDLIIEGNQEKPDVEGYIQNTFLRRWTLPDDVDLDAVETSLNEYGCLVVDAPKTGLHTLRRELPIKVSSSNGLNRAVLA